MFKDMSWWQIGLAVITYLFVITWFAYYIMELLKRFGIKGTLSMIIGFIMEAIGVIILVTIIYGVIH